MHDNHDRVVRIEHGRLERIVERMAGDDLRLARVIGDAVLVIDLAAQEFRHLGMEAEALGEPDHRLIARFHHRQQGQEKRLERAEFAECAPRLTAPVVLDDRRHLPVVADYDQVAIKLEREGRHHRFRQVHLGRFVQNQRVDEMVAEELGAPSITDEVVDTAGRRADDTPALPFDRLDGFGVSRKFPVLRPERLDLFRQLLAGIDSKARNVQQSGVEVPCKDLGLGRLHLRKGRPGGDDVLEEHVRGRVGLAREDDPVVPPRGHGALHPCQHGEATCEALASARRPLDHQGRNVAMAADEVLLALLEGVERPRIMQRFEPGEERGLTLGGRFGPGGNGLVGTFQPAIKRVVLAVLLKPVNDLGAPGPIEVVRVWPQGIQLAIHERSVVGTHRPKREFMGIVVVIRSNTHRSYRSNWLSVVIGSFDQQLLDVSAQAVEHRSRGWGKRTLLVFWESGVCCPPRMEDDTLARPYPGQCEKFGQ